MSAGVDVLAVMDRELIALARAAERAGDFGRAIELNEARAAVAELIEAASAGTPENGDRAVSPGLWFGPQRATRLRNAIARVGGAA